MCLPNGWRARKWSWSKSEIIRFGRDYDFVKTVSMICPILHLPLRFASTKVTSFISFPSFRDAWCKEDLLGRAGQISSELSVSSNLLQIRVSYKSSNKSFWLTYWKIKVEISRLGNKSDFFFTFLHVSFISVANNCWACLHGKTISNCPSLYWKYTETMSDWTFNINQKVGHSRLRSSHGSFLQVYEIRDEC